MEQRGRVVMIEDIERIIGRLFIQSEMLREEVMRLERELTEIRQGGEGQSKARKKK